jgi:hypothetical protein
MINMDNESKANAKENLNTYGRTINVFKISNGGAEDCGVLGNDYGKYEIDSIQARRSGSTSSDRDLW